jgi:non-heme chloroperoxidase
LLIKKIFKKMSTITVKDGTQIYYKDWGTGQPIVFHHGWPLSGDDWDTQMMFFLNQGYRVIAHDRRGHGRSGQSSQGNDMDTYVADVAELTAALDLKDAIHIGHSTGGGEVIRYVAKHGKGRVAKAVLISAVTPIMVKTDNNPEGVPISVFDEIREGTGFTRAQYFYDFPLAFYGWNREGATVQEGIKHNWWRQGMMGSVLAHYAGIKAFSESDFTKDLKSVDVPVLVLHGEDDQIVPYNQAPKAAELLQNGKLISYPGFPHGMPTTEAATINKDILEFIRS